MSSCLETVKEACGEKRQSTVYVGLDVHEFSISLAGLCKGRWAGTGPSPWCSQKGQQTRRDTFAQYSEAGLLRLIHSRVAFPL